MKNMLAMFPGQGSQFVGMAKEVIDLFPSVRVYFEEAEDSCKIPIRRLCNEGPEETLQLTSNQQPCILTVSIAYWKVLQNEAGLMPSLFAGHSLGEYSALVAAGKLAFGEAVRLVHLRGQAMQAAVPEGKGAMAAVLNSDETKLLALCKKVTAAAKDGVAEVVNFNSPQQHIISGTKKEVETVCQLLSAEKIRSKMLPVSAPFHSSLMIPAKEKMATILAATALLETPQKVIANLTGKIADPYQTDLLIEQIDHPVLWTKSLETAHQSDAELFLEIGPGTVLSGLAKRTLPENTVIKNMTQIKDTITFLQQN